MDVIGSIDFVKADGIDGFEQIIGEVRFLYDFLLHRTRTFAHYILPDKIMYDVHNATINYVTPEKFNLMTVNHDRPHFGNVSIMFYKSDGSDLDLHFLTHYVDTNIVKMSIRSLEAFSSLLILRCRSAFEEGVPIGSAISDNINTPEFYYMSRNLYGTELAHDLLQQFMDYGLPFPDYILKTAVDTGDLEYAAALVHEKDALQMKVKEESLRL